MAAKEEALILKYLKKNPDSEALDVSFGTDVDESVVKETLQQLLSKQQVAEKVSDSGISTWTIAVPPPKPVAPKPEKPAKVAKSDDDVSVDVPASSDDDDASPSSGKGSGKGFVLVVAVLTAAISIGASYVIGSSKIASEKAAFDLQLKNATDSVGFYKIETNQKIDALQQEIKKLQAPPAEEAAKPAAKAAPKKVVKKK